MNNSLYKEILIDPLNLEETLTRNSCLIEASAGTGKSFILVFSYIRLVLGANTGRECIEPKNLLVLTFTVEATNLLKIRLINTVDNLILIIKKYKKKIDLNPMDDYWLKLLKRSVLWPDLDSLLIRLNNIRIELLDPSIFTIHGFCLKILKNWSFRLSYKKPNLNKSNALIWLSISTFWNKTIAMENKVFSLAFLESFKEVEDLFNEVMPLLDQSVLIIEGSLENEEIFTDYYKEHISRIEEIATIFYRYNITDWEEAFKKHLKTQKGITIQSSRWVNKINKLFDNLNLNKEYENTFDILNNLSQYELKTNNSNFIWFIDWFKLLATTIRLWVHPKQTMLNLAIRFCKNVGNHIAWNEGRVSFRDLLDQICNGLESDIGKCSLHKELRETFPIVFIDEFQDTDVKQYQILECLYLNKNNCQLFLIGDPKQSIYGFRGADLSTYFKASNSVNEKANLINNWRSSEKLINGINYLWEDIKNPFIYNEIKFKSCVYPNNKGNTELLFEGNEVSAIKLNICKPNSNNSQITLSEYKKRSAQWCSYQVYRFVKGMVSEKVYIFNSKLKEKTKLIPNDIAILVRNSTEAKLIMSNLKTFGVSSHFTSQETNLLKSDGGVLLLDTLQAIAYNGEFGTILQLLSNPIFFGMKDNFPIYSKDFNDNIKKSFLKAYYIWIEYGLAASVQSIVISYFNILFNKIEYITEKSHFYQLMELLIPILDEKDLTYEPYIAAQSVSDIVNNSSLDFELYFKAKIDRVDPFSVNISTVFKSKGLEYPIVFIPFISAPIRNNNVKFGSIYKSGALVPINNLEENTEASSESMRLLYVAMTRAIYHLNIFASPVHITKYGNVKTFSPFQYLLSKGKNNLLTLDSFYNRINEIGDEGKIFKIDYEEPKYFHCKNCSSALYDLFRQLERKDLNYNVSNDKSYIKTNWSIKSYSSLVDNIGSNIKNLMQFTFIDNLLGVNNSKYWLTYDNKEVMKDSYFDEYYDNFEKTIELIKEDYINNKVIDNSLFSRVAKLPKGPVFGDFIHKILETWDFNSKINIDQFRCDLIINNDNGEYNDIIEWLDEVVEVDIIDGIRLKNIDSKKICSEMNFLLKISQRNREDNFLTALLEYNLIDSKCKDVNIQYFEGCIKGFVDLIFEFNNKYYIIDYKTNYLGSDYSDYDQDSLNLAMLEHNYNLQSSIYQIALHKHLKNNLSCYKPKKHLGDTIYLFLRGMTDRNKKYGIWTGGMSVDQILDLEERFFNA